MDGAPQPHGRAMRGLTEAEIIAREARPGSPPAPMGVYVRVFRVLVVVAFVLVHVTFFLVLVEPE